MNGLVHGFLLFVIASWRSRRFGPGIRYLGWPLTLVRPSLLDAGPRPDNRPGERVALWFAGIFQPLLTARYRGVRTDAVEGALLAAALARAPGVHVIESERTA
jgi:hypothetical protein